MLTVGHDGTGVWFVPGTNSRHILTPAQAYEASRLFAVHAAEAEKAEYSGPKFKERDWFVLRDRPQETMCITGQPRFEGQWLYPVVGKDGHRKEAHVEHLVDTGFYLPIPPKPVLPADSECELTGEVREPVDGESFIVDGGTVVYTQGGEYECVTNHAVYGYRRWILRRVALTGTACLNANAKREHAGRMFRFRDELFVVTVDPATVYVEPVCRATEYCYSPHNRGWCDLDRCFAGRADELSDETVTILLEGVTT